MVNLIRILFLMLMVSFVVACMSNKTVFVPVGPESTIDKHAADKRTTNKKPAKNNGSVVYVYRPTKIANVMLTPDLSIAGVEKIAMANGVYKKIYMSPGVYAVRLQEIEGSTESVEHELKVTRGQVYYLRVDASMKLDTGAQGYQPYKRKFELKNVPSKQAKKEIVHCKDMDAVKKRKPVARSENGNADGDDASFSVDKTQNPFSH